MSSHKTIDALGRYHKTTHSKLKIGFIGLLDATSLLFLNDKLYLV